MRKQAKFVAVLSAAALLAVGASMTAFAATPHWDMEDGEWVYLDRNGDRVTDVWKKSNGQWYYLDGDGYMAKDQVIETDDDAYYVGADGARVVNAWVSMDNDDLLDDDDEPEAIDTVWMYFDASGKALGYNGNEQYVVKKLNYGEGQSGYFMFNDAGYMLSGWKTRTRSDNKTDLYYLGNQNEGWATTGWKQLEVNKDLSVFQEIDDDDDGETFWFYFRPNGKAYKDETTSYNGKTYAFEADGRMLELWTYKENGSYTNVASSSAGTPGNAAAYYAEDNGGRDKNWVYAYPNSKYEEYDDDQYWFWLNSKGRAFRAGERDDGRYGVAERLDDTDKSGSAYSGDANSSGIVEAKVIKSSTYLFNDKGVTLTGLFNITTAAPKGNSQLSTGIYLFDTSSYPSSNTGKMVTNKKMTIDVNGSDETYYFGKNGNAYTSAVISSLVYDKSGKLVLDYGDGSTYELVDIQDITDPNGDGLYVLTDKSDKIVFSSSAGDAKVLINGYGRMKTSSTCKDINDISWEITKSGNIITGVKLKD